MFSGTSTSMARAVSNLIAKWQSLILKYNGSPNGATCTISTTFPGKQPISNNFSGILLRSKSFIIAFWPMARLDIDMLKFI